MSTAVEPPTMPPFQQLNLALAGVLLILSRRVDGFAVSTRLGSSSSSSMFGTPYSYSTRSGVAFGAAAGEASSAAPVEAAEGGHTEEELPQALIFDCDGVLADTERDGHRPAFNAAFKIKNLGKSTRTRGHWKDALRHECGARHAKPYMYYIFTGIILVQYYTRVY